MMKEVSPQLLADYNDQRMFSTTLDLYAGRNKQHSDEGSVALHYQAVVAGLMLDRNIDDIIRRLKGCHSYDSIVKGDLCRDQAFSLIRKHQQLDEAERLIRCAIEYHRDNPERQAIALQAYGRLQEVRGEPSIAYTVLCDALDTHKDCPWPRNKVWMANTAFHTLRLAIKINKRSERQAHQALRIVTHNDPSWKKRWAARAMYYLPGASGVRLVERFV